jgi:hypothetical protein
MADFGQVHYKGKINPGEKYTVYPPDWHGDLSVPGFNYEFLPQTKSLVIMSIQDRNFFLNHKDKFEVSGGTAQVKKMKGSKEVEAPTEEEVEIAEIEEAKKKK